MSKILLIALAALIVISLAACSAPEKAEETVEAPAAEAKAATTPEPTPEPTPESTPTPTPEPIAVVLQSIPLARIAEADIPKHEKLEIYAREILAQADAKKTEVPEDMEYVEIPWIYEVAATGSDEIAKDLSFTVYSFTDKDGNVQYRAWGQKPAYDGGIEAEGFYEIAFTEDEDGELMLELKFDGLNAEPVDLEKEKAIYPEQPNKEKLEKSEGKADTSTKADSGAKTDASESGGGNGEQPENPAPKPEAPAPAPPVDKEREDFNKEQQEHIDKVVNGDGSGYDIDVEPPPDSF